MPKGFPKNGKRLFRRRILKPHKCAECGTKIDVVYCTSTARCSDCEYAKYINNNKYLNIINN
jgi:predicted Zn-ribbon and HTH transcriptional regulator